MTTRKKAATAIDIIRNGAIDMFSDNRYLHGPRVRCCREPGNTGISPAPVCNMSPRTPEPEAIIYDTQTGGRHPHSSQASHNVLLMVP